MDGKYLDLSTGHMTAEDNLMLTHIADGGNDLTGLNVGSIRYGFVVSVPGDYLGAVIHDIEEHGMSDEFRQLLEYASKNGYGLIRFDRDGDTLPDFRVFDW